VIDTEDTTPQKCGKCDLHHTSLCMAVDCEANKRDVYFTFYKEVKIRLDDNTYKVFSALSAVHGKSVETIIEDKCHSFVAKSWNFF